MRRLIYLAGVSLSTDPEHFPHIKVSFTYMTLVISQLYPVTYVSSHLFISNIAHVHSNQSFSRPPLAHRILTHPTNTCSYTRTILHITPLYTIPLPFHARQLLTHRPYLHSPYAQIVLTLYRLLHISPHLIPSSTSTNE